MQGYSKNIFIWLAVMLLIIGLFNYFQQPAPQQGNAMVDYSEFLGYLNAGQVSEVTLRGDVVSGTLKDAGNTRFATLNPGDMKLIERLEAANVRMKARLVEEQSSGVLGMLLSWFPMLLFIGVWIFFMRQMQSGTGKAMGFGKSRARMLTEKTGRVTFEDVAGIDEAKVEL
ncbi:MAG: ATP-dependent metallopeptidase FtsH/Yme1/Tma family protein, partial [Holosporales bacterium]